MKVRVNICYGSKNYNGVSILRGLITPVACVRCPNTVLPVSLA